MLRPRFVQRDEHFGYQGQLKSPKTVSIHAKFKCLAVFRFKSSRFAPLHGPRGAESGDHFQFECHVYDLPARFPWDFNRKQRVIVATIYA
jgi:hypothetical protein